MHCPTNYFCNSFFPDEYAIEDASLKKTKDNYLNIYYNLAFILSK